jgi:membrane-associated phospholipid phosphatase
MIKRITPILLLLTISCQFVSAQGLDLDIAKAINPSDPSSKYWRGTSSSAYVVSGVIPLTMLAAGFIEHDPILKKKSYEVIASIAIEFLISDATKIIVNRQRPGEKHPGIIFPYKDMHGRSFPSGHSSLAFATAASLSIQYHKWYVTVPAYLWAGSVAYSRVYLGVHYPSDVLAGAAIGVGSAYLAHWLDHLLFAKKTARPL